MSDTLGCGHPDTAQARATARTYPDGAVICRTCLSPSSRPAQPIPYRPH